MIEVFKYKILVGFASITSEFLRYKNQYLEHSALHTLYEKRGKGIGKKLMFLMKDRVKLIGAKKVYISAHLSVELQVFYKSDDCQEAEE